MEETNWGKAFKPLLKKYKHAGLRLQFENLYQLLVMVLLAAQDSDDKINEVTKEFFQKFPTLHSLKKVDPTDLHPYLHKVRSYVKKSSWLVGIANEIKHVPTTMDELTALKGIGRKSANVVMSQAGVDAEGIVVDLHVIRVVNRLGISKESDGVKIEKDLMKTLPRDIWGEVGLALSTLGAEVCRPTAPKHEQCVLSKDCEYCKLKYADQ